MATETERMVFDIDRRLAVVEGKLNGGNAFATREVCDERHRASEERMTIMGHRVTSVDVRLWALVILALSTLVAVIAK